MSYVSGTAQQQCEADASSFVNAEALDDEMCWKVTSHIGYHQITHHRLLLVRWRAGSLERGVRVRELQSLASWPHVFRAGAFPKDAPNLYLETDSQVRAKRVAFNGRTSAVLTSGIRKGETASDPTGTRHASLTRLLFQRMIQARARTTRWARHQGCVGEASIVFVGIVVDALLGRRRLRR